VRGRAGRCVRGTGIRPTRFAARAPETVRQRPSVDAS